MPSDVGLSEIHWIWKDAVLAQSLLLQLDEDSVRAVMALPSCTDRVCELFRVVKTRVVRRAELATVAGNSYELTIQSGIMNKIQIAFSFEGR